MRFYSFVSAAMSGVFMVGMSTTALAGSFGVEAYESGSGQRGCDQHVPAGTICDSRLNAQTISYEGVRNSDCNVQTDIAASNPCTARVINHDSVEDNLAPIHVYNSAPYGYLKTFAYKNTPNVNVMRVHSRKPQVAITDVPTSFAKSCNSAPNEYCRQPVQAPRPIASPLPRPVIQPRPVPVMRPIHISPCYSPCGPSPLQRRTMHRTNPANFAPRVYGNNVLTPGTAHIPTSIVDRSAITHIDGIPQQRVSSVTTVNGTYGVGSTSTRSVIGGHQMNGRINHAGARGSIGGNVIGRVSGGSYSYYEGGSPDYWEKTSGPTIVDGLPATQIVCRRPGTAGTLRTVNVERPVIGVPTPVPAPVCVPGSQVQYMQQHPTQPLVSSSTKHRQMPSSRWTQ